RVDVSSDQQGLFTAKQFDELAKLDRLGLDQQRKALAVGGGGRSGGAVHAWRQRWLASISRTLAIRPSAMRPASILNSPLAIACLISSTRCVSTSGVWAIAAS